MQIKAKTKQRPQKGNQPSSKSQKSRPKPTPPVPKFDYHSSTEDEGDDDIPKDGSDEDDGGPSSGPSTLPLAMPKPTVGKKRPRRKKGKVFLEDKAGLLSLLDGVTASKDAVIATKLERERGRVAAAEARSVGAEVKVGKRAEARAKALDAAKDAIVAREKEKRARRKQRSTGEPAEGAAASAGGKPSESARKRVGFA